MQLLGGRDDRALGPAQAALVPRERGGLEPALGLGLGFGFGFGFGFHTVIRMLEVGIHRKIAMVHAAAVLHVCVASQINNGAMNDFYLQFLFIYH